MKTRAARALCALLTLPACNGSTSGDLVQVPFSVGGPAFADGGPLLFRTARGWDVELDLAKVDVGPFYFNVDPSNTTDYRSGIVIQESLQQVTVDLLDPILHEVKGGTQGEAGTAVAAEIDLLPPGSTVTDSDVCGPSGCGGNPTAFAVLAGVASVPEDGGAVVPFKGWIALSDGDATDTAPLPWLQRVNGAACNLDFTIDGGDLTLRVDPTGWFDTADFVSLLPVGDGGEFLNIPDGGPYGWTDPSDFNAAVLNQIQGTNGVYTFTLGTATGG